MFEARNMTAVPRNDRVEPPARTGPPGAPADRIRPRWWWGLVALAVVLSAGLQIAIVTNLLGRIAPGKAPGPAPSPAASTVSPGGAEELSSNLAPPRVTGSPKPEEGRPGADAGESKDARPADDRPRPPVAGPAGPPNPVADVPVPAADPVALGASSSPGTGGPTIPTATAATAWGRCTTQPRASTATTREDRAVAGPLTATCRWSRASATCSCPGT